MPEVFYDGKYRPICGVGSWSNNKAAKEMCRRMGFSTGRMTKTFRRFRYRPKRLGCNDDDVLSVCEGLSFMDVYCTVLSAIGVKVTCENEMCEESCAGDENELCGGVSWQNMYDITRPAAVSAPRISLSEEPCALRAFRPKAPQAFTLDSTNWQAGHVVPLSCVRSKLIKHAETVQFKFDMAIKSKDRNYARSEVLPLQGYCAADAVYGLSVTYQDSHYPDSHYQGQPPVSGLPVESVVLREGKDLRVPFTVHLLSVVDEAVYVIFSSNSTRITPPDNAFISGSRYRDTVVMGVINDAVSNGPEPFCLTAVVSSTNAHYSGMQATVLCGTVLDDDEAGVRVHRVGDVTTTTESGRVPVRFDISLTSQPMGVVELELQTDPTTEAAFQESILTFDSETWKRPQTVHLFGKDDNVVDGPQTFTFSIAVKSADTDYDYAALAPVTGSLVNLDNDVAGVSCSPRVLITSESDQKRGGGDTLSCSLTSAPTSPVRLSVHLGSDQPVLLKGSSTCLLPANTTCEFFLFGRDDERDTGNTPFRLSVMAESSDPHYSELPPTRVAGTNMDDDVSGLEVRNVLTCVIGCCIYFHDRAYECCRRQVDFYFAIMHAAIKAWLLYWDSDNTISSHTDPQHGTEDRRERPQRPRHLHRGPHVRARVHCDRLRSLRGRERRGGARDYLPHIHP